MGFNSAFNPLKAELNPICHLLALLVGATIVVVSRLRVKGLKSGGGTRSRVDQEMSVCLRKTSQILQPVRVLSHTGKK